LLIAEHFFLINFAVCVVSFRDWTTIFSGFSFVIRFFNYSSAKKHAVQSFNLAVLFLLFHEKPQHHMFQLGKPSVLVQAHAFHPLDKLPLDSFYSLLHP